MGLYIRSEYIMVQMMKMQVYFKAALRLHRGNGCAARGPSVLVQLAMMRRIFLSDGMWMRAVIREKNYETYFGKIS